MFVEVRAADLYYTKEGRQPVCRKSLVSCDDDMMINDDMAMMTMMMDDRTIMMTYITLY